MSVDHQLSSYDYLLPPELIAQQPLPARDASRLMVLRRHDQTLEHRCFRDLPELLSPGDLLVVNETRVIPARLAGVRRRTGGRWEGLYLGCTPEGDWRLLGQTRGKLQPGEWIDLRELSAGGTPREGRPFGLQLRHKEPGGIWCVTPEAQGDPVEVLARYGATPLPPYIAREQPAALDVERYQTVYASRPGAVAAPTAGLHFTPEVLSRCREQSIEVATVTLHVGIGTFRPISVERITEHQMHAEWCEVPQATVAAIQAARQRGGRIVAVGTTSVRTLEAAALAAESSAQGGPAPAGQVDLAPYSGETSIFIYPPYRFRVVDALVTNLHLPRSSLLLLVSAFAGREFVLQAYAAAVSARYRFFSYGDAMLIL